MAEHEQQSNGKRRVFLWVRLVLFTLLSVFLFSMGSIAPFLGFWGQLLSPLPVALLGFWDGPRWLLSGVFLVFLLLWPSSPVWSVYFLLGYGSLAGALLFSAFRKRWSGSESLVFCVLVSTLSKIILLGSFVFLTGHNPFVPDSEQMFGILMQFYSQLPLSNEQLEALKAAMREIAFFFPYMMPALVLLSSLLDAFINYVFSCFLGARFAFARRLAPLPDLASWRFSKTLLPAVLLAFLIGAFWTTEQWFYGVIFAANLKLVVNVLFYFQGFSLVVWWMRRRRWRAFGRALVTALMLMPMLWIWSVFLGIADMALDFRERVQKKPSP